MKTFPFRPFQASMITRGAMVLAASGWLASAGAAENYLGAEAVLKKLAAQAAAPPDADGIEQTESARLRRDLKAFREKAASLPPAEAASGWLALADRLAKTGVESRLAEPQEGEPLSSRDLLAALPPPAAWDALAKAIETRPTAQGKRGVREISLRLLAHTLTSDGVAQNKDLAALKDWLAKAGRRDGQFFISLFQQLNEALLENSGDADAILESLSSQMSQIENGEDKQTLRLPDLASLVGNEKAETWLRKALRAPNVELEIVQGEETLHLAQRLALAMIQDLQVPQWHLAYSVDAMDLYEALEKRFARKTEGKVEPGAAVPKVSDLPMDSERYGAPKHLAQLYYLLGLIVAQRSQDAAALAQKLGLEEFVNLPDDVLAALERAGHTRALYDFFHELLSQNPDLPYWEEYVQLAAKAGQTDKMLMLVRAASKRDGLGSKQRAAIRSRLYKALLAADQVEEAVQEMRELLGGGKGGSDDSEGVERRYERAQLGIALARLGKLLNRKEWINEARVALYGSAGSRFGYEFVVQSLAEMLAELGRGPEAETALTDALTRAVRAGQTPGLYEAGAKTETALLAALARLYHLSGRHADVLTLLDQATQWQARDLVELYTEDVNGFARFQSNSSKAELPLSYLAADALAVSGRKTEARKIIDAMLDRDGGFDPGYQLLIQLGGDDVIARLDALFARDPFEERPLIWKAALLAKASRLEEAEKLARQAIAIDPSDGEQGPGRRMRAYAVLADIREARGDKKEAQFLRGAIKAIRLSEDADRFYEAGLLKQAVKMYEESLTYFADAYCIQSRLALRLADLGMHEAAEAHYRRAFELMPDSFGRVESHCFGCEHVFEGQKAQSLAEKVFRDLAVKTPDKPQVHYLLGYLREEQGRFKEALPHFRTAVRLDPNYLNAWAHLASVSRSVRLPTAERDSIALNLIRLDPLNRHGQSGGERAQVTDLRGLWAAVEVAAKLQPPKPTSLYPLAASQAELEKRERDPKSRRENRQRRRSRFDPDEELSPAAVIARHDIIALVAPFIGNEYAQMFEE